MNKAIWMVQNTSISASRLVETPLLF